jgi:cysteinyl-tRNA synthetase
MHVGMVTINSEKMSKSLRNMVILNTALKKWGSNVLRLYLISSQYSKPMDYNDEILQESLQKWRQIEHCIYELITTKNESEDIREFEEKCNTLLGDFLSALESNLNTPLALSAFMKLVSYVNNLSSSEKLTVQMADKALPILYTIMDIVGLKIIKVDNDAKEQIEQKIVERNKLRGEKKFQEADLIRQEILEIFNVELTDHSNYTSWKKKEVVEYESEN